MGLGNIQVGQARCSRCGKMVKTERNSINWGTGDLLFIVMTLGLWVVVKRLFNRMGNPWRCSVCGERV